MGNGIKTAAKWGKGLTIAAAGAATAVVGALLKMDEATAEYRENMGKLTTAWEASGHDAATAKKAYSELYKVMGDKDAATEAAQLLSSVAQGTEDVSKWSDIAAGVAGKFGDSLPVESLIEAANETQKTGALTGALADALNWAGIQEDDFQAKLDACSTEQERNKLITETLSTTYQSSTEAFKANNAEVLAARDAQARLDEATAKLGAAVGTVKTQLAEEFTPEIAAVTEAFAALTAGEEGAEEQLQESVQAMVDKIVAKLPDFLSFGVDIITAIAKGLVQNLPYLLKKAPELVGELVLAFADLGEALFDVGADMLSDLWDGAKGKWRDIEDWVERKSKWLINKIAFWRRGKAEMEDGPEPDPRGGGSHAAGLNYVPYDGYRAVLHRGETVLNADNSRSMVEDIVNGMAAVMGSRSASSGTVIVPVYLDGREIARAVWDPLQDEADRRGEPIIG